MRLQWLAGLVGCVLLSQPLVAQEKGPWGELVSDEALFRVLLPGQPEEKLEGNKRTFTCKLANGVIFYVESMEYKEGAVKGREEEFLRARKKLFRDALKARVTNDEKFSFEGRYPGREYVLEAGPAAALIRDIVVDDRLYNIRVVATKEYLKSAMDAKEFMLSFQFFPGIANDKKAPIEGAWSGSGKNGQGEDISETFQFKGAMGKTIKAAFTGNIELTGRRVMPGCFLFEGKNDSRSVTVFVRTDGTEMSIAYEAIRTDEPGRTYGWAIMKKD